MKFFRKLSNISLTGRMFRTILLCWVIPFIALSAMMLTVYIRRNERQVINTAMTSASSAAAIVTETSRSAVESSRQATYDGVIKKCYETYLKTGDEQTHYREVSVYLNETYRFSKLISNTILLYTDPMQYEYYVYSNVAGATYTSIEEFKHKTAQAVRAEAKNLDTRTKYSWYDGHLYVIRNIVRSNYTPFTTLVMELNMDRFFEPMNNLIWREKGIAVLEGEIIWEDGDTEAVSAEEASELYSRLTENELWQQSLAGNDSLVSYDRKHNNLFLALRCNDQILYFAYELDDRDMFADRFAFWSVYGILFITLIPLVFATFYFFHSNITGPINGLVDASKKIEDGEYGVQAQPFDKNEELGQLVDTFNHMSSSLEESFRRIYAEEVAERDATLKALQAQINPHFLNNTLEIINWKARLSGMNDVSAMIEALSVMMNATLNRNNENFIALREELQYVDAYIYIIRQRFGDRFVFDKSVDEDLLTIQVPRLILQPLVENAVEHGGDRYGHLRTRLRLWVQEEERTDAGWIAAESDPERTETDSRKAGTEQRKVLCMVVENNGELTSQDREKVARLLADVDRSNVGGLLSRDKIEGLDRQSIGIRNVHLRLRLLYGEGSGLTISNDGQGITTSMIRIVLSSGRELA